MTGAAACIRRLMGAMALAGLAGCASTPIYPPPLLDLGARQCPATPDFSSAVPIAFNGKDATTVSALIGPASPCLSGPDGQSLYVVYRLPDAKVPYVAMVASNPQGQALLALRVILFAEDGAPTRSFESKAITFRGDALTALLRNHDGERYLVVASDPRAVGTETRRIDEAVHVTQGAAAGGSFVVFYSVHTGSETQSTYTLSHNGSIAVTLTPVTE